MSLCLLRGNRFGRIVVLTILAVLLGVGVGLAQTTLRVGIGVPSQFDPAFSASPSELLVMRSIYDYLVDIDTRNNIIPALATSWEVSDDGLVYTFTLTEGVTFHDGSAFTAEDVVWTFNRLRDPVSGRPSASIYANIANISADNEYQVSFTLTEVDPFFLYNLSDYRSLMLKAGTDDFNLFNGTGAFVVSDYSVGNRMSLMANGDYFIEGQPGVEVLEFVFFSDQVASVDALRGGQVDIVLEMPLPLFETLSSARGITTVSIPTNNYDVVRLRADRAPGNDPRVVEALKLAVDRQVIFDAVKNGIGALGIDSPIGPLYGNYHAADLTPPARDAERARALLAEAGYPDGLSLTLRTPDSGDRPDLAVVLQQQLAEAGFDIEISIEPESVYYGDGGWLEADFGISGWGSRAIGQYYLDAALVCDGVWNESRYCNEEFDELVQLAGTTLDEDIRMAAYREIQEILLAEAPIIIPYFSAVTAAHSDAVAGFNLQAYVGRTNLATVTLE